MARPKGGTLECGCPWVREGTQDVVHVVPGCRKHGFVYEPARAYEAVAECPYCGREYASVSGFASHLLRRHKGSKIPNPETWMLTVAGKT